MRSRELPYLLIVLVILALGGIFFLRSLLQQQPGEILAATARRDCAPWDGPAFTLTVQYAPETVIQISIWRSPELRFPTTFELPDDEGQTGMAYIQREPGQYVPVNGEIFFQQVEMGMPIKGRFSFTSKNGEKLRGLFMAEWENEVVYCG